MYVCMYEDMFAPEFRVKTFFKEYFVIYYYISTEIFINIQLLTVLFLIAFCKVSF